MFRSAYLASPGCGSAGGRKMYIDKVGNQRSSLRSHVHWTAEDQGTKLAQAVRSATYDLPLNYQPSPKVSFGQ